MTPDIGQPVALGALLSNPDETKSRADGIIKAKGLNPDERVILAGDLLLDVANAMCSAAYGGSPEGQDRYARDFARVVGAVRATGIPAVRGNAIAVAWALGLMQGARLERLSGPPGGTP